MIPNPSGSGFRITDEDVRQYRGLVLSIVKKRLRNAKHLRPVADDLIQEGYLGLMHAATKFDDTRDTKFATYAGFWVYEFVRREALNLHQTLTTGRYSSGHLKTNDLWKPDRVATDLKGNDITPASLPAATPSPERQVILKDLAEKLAQRVPKGRNGQIYLERANVDRNTNDVPLTQGRQAGASKGEAAGEGSLPHIAEKFGLTRERVRQISNEVEADVRAWGAEVAKEAA